LRNFAKNLEGNFEKISIDLKSCVGMDSTFMGILAMIGLKAKNANAIVEIVNADENNRHLLKGLGLEKLFNFVQHDVNGRHAWKKEETQKKDQLTTAETVAEAHKVLMDVDDENVPKFEKVVEFAEDDVKRLKAQQEKTKEQEDD
jgi:ABC-type transporter Mla MlaB component